jgi:zinc protease
MLQLLHLKLTAPRGDARLLAARQAQVRAVLPQYVTTPEYRVAEAWRQRFYADQPGQNRPDDPALLDATVEDMRAIHRARFANARGFELLLIGDLDPEATLPLLDRWVGSLPAEAAPPPTARGDERMEYPVAPGAFTTRAGREAKAEWRLSMHAPAEASPDALIRLMALHESLRIVLTEALREEMGSTYSPSASRWLDPTGAPRQFIRIDLELAPDQVDAARARVERELARLAAEGPSADVLERVVAGWLTQLPITLRTNGYWRGRFVNTRVQPELESDPATLEARARAITPESLVPLARALFVDGVRLEQTVLPEE